MSEVNMLLVGESWQTTETHTKGFDSFSNASYTEAADHLLDAVEANGIDADYQPSHVAAEEFPDSLDALAAYDAVVLSDIGYNTLAVPPSTFSEFERNPNRIQLLHDYVNAGGGLLMVGGYMSFTGFRGNGGYRNTPIEDALPVSLGTFDDHVERSDGAEGDPVASHPVLEGVPEEWPHFLGYNRVTPDAGAEELVRIADDPLLVVGEEGEGRSAAFTSDCAPHWGPPAFTDWEGYGPLWSNLVRWLADA
jgi:uncharacterized membrane protein